MRTFSERLLHWHRRHGRKDLPWLTRDPYSVWVSEIMLQQTQVATVIPYYTKFMQRFGDIATLAAAPSDEVLHYWSGLGYYARARNLQRAAKQVVERHGGVFPREFDQVLALSGIGHSTAAAILAFCFDQRRPILDGNVKRVLARHFAVAGYPGEKAVQARLWALADELTPTAHVADYTQAIMDLGALLCRRKPHCAACPVQHSCQAYQTDQVPDYPRPKPRQPRPQRAVLMPLIVNSQAQVLLQQKPPRGIWGGLWSLPEVDPATFNQRGFDLADWCQSHLGIMVTPEHAPRRPQTVKHSFTHYDLTITVLRLYLHESAACVMDAPPSIWYAPGTAVKIGLPAPIAKLLGQVAS